MITKTLQNTVKMGPWWRPSLEKLPEATSDL